GPIITTLRILPSGPRRRARPALGCGTGARKHRAEAAQDGTDLPRPRPRSRRATALLPAPGLGRREHARVLLLLARILHRVAHGRCVRDHESEHAGRGLARRARGAAGAARADPPGLA